MIYRQMAIDALDKEYRCTDKSDDWDGLETAMLIIENLPSAQPLTAYVISDEDGNIKCSNCGSFECWGNYCMNCGAKMER